MLLVKELEINTKPLSRRAMIAIPLGILIGGAAIGIILTKLKTPPPRVPREAVATFVEVVTVHSKSEREVISGFGTVQPHRQVMLRPEVSGLVIEQHPDLIEGGVIERGNVLVQIDPREYDLAVEQQRASLISAQSALALEQGRQVVAKQEWEYLAPSLETDPASKSLALREPYLAETKAALLAAESNLKRAELDLERTSIRAPFNALVRARDIEVGQHVDTQTVAATLVDVDSFDVLVSVPTQFLGSIALPKGDGTQGAHAQVTQKLGNGNSVTYEGRVIRLLGDVDPNGRMARVLVSIADPMGRRSAQVDVPTRPAPLLLSSYVRVDIEGEMLGDVFSIPRRSLREGNRVWVKNAQGQLEIREVDVLSHRDGIVLVRGELANGEDVITSVLPVALPGMQLRTTHVNTRERKLARADQDGDQG